MARGLLPSREALVFHFSLWVTSLGLAAVWDLADAAVTVWRQVPWGKPGKAQQVTPFLEKLLRKFKCLYVIIVNMNNSAVCLPSLNFFFRSLYILPLQYCQLFLS